MRAWICRIFHRSQYYSNSGGYAGWFGWVLTGDCGCSKCGRTWDG